MRSSDRRREAASAPSREQCLGGDLTGSWLDVPEPCPTPCGLPPRRPELGRSVPVDLGHVRSPRGTGSLLRWSTPRSPLPWPYAPATGPRGGWTTLTWARREHHHEFTRQRVYVVPIPYRDRMTGTSGAARPPRPIGQSSAPLHHSAGSVTARYLRCSVRVLSGARGKAGPPWIPAAPRDESRWPCAGGSITSLHTTRPASRPAALPACSPRPRTWPDPTDQHRPSRSRLSSRSGHRRRLTSRQAHAQSRSVATWRSYRRPHAAATHRRNPPDSPRVTDRGAVQLRTLANSSATKRIHAER